MICGNCGKSIQDGAVFCTHCGARCIKKVCKAYGAELKDGQLFCPVCGLKGGSGASQDEEPPITQSAIRQKEQDSGGAVPAGRGGKAAGKFSRITRIVRMMMNVVWLGCLIFLILDDGLLFWWEYATFRWFTYATFAGVAHTFYLRHRRIHTDKEETKGDRILGVIFMILPLIVLLLSF